jgi:hypothetical protein
MVKFDGKSVACTSEGGLRVRGGERSQEEDKRWEVKEGKNLNACPRKHQARSQIQLTQENRNGTCRRGV